MSCTDPVDLQPALLDDQRCWLAIACESAAALQPSCQVARMERTCGFAIYAATGNPRLPSHCFYVVAHCYGWITAHSRRGTRGSDLTPKLRTWMARSLLSTEIKDELRENSMVTGSGALPLAQKLPANGSS